MSHPSAPSSSLQRSFHDRANSRYSPYTRPSPPVSHNTDYVPGGRIMRLSPAPQRRPASTIWLQSLNPGWTDGAVEPPQFYHSHAEMNETRAQYGYAPLIRSPSPLDRPVLQQVNHSEPPNSQGHTVNYDVRADENNRRRVEEGRLVEQPEFEVERAVTPDLAIQCNVHVAVVRTSVSMRTSRSKPPSSKTTTTTKADRISISPTMTRVSFIEACLQVHDPHPRYRPTSVGPRFLMQWTGVAKAKACCIDDDRNFSSALKMFLDKARDKKGKLDLSVEFDLNSLEAFRIPDTFNPAPNPGDDQGTEIPYVGQFTEDEQLHGGIILMLKQAWLCGKHLGEHREPGYCYVPKDATERHYGLNARKLRVWAAAIAAHECSKHEPPPEVLDGGCRDGEPSADVVRSRGRTGPRPGPVQPLLDPTTLLTAAIVPLLTSMAERTIKPSSSTIASAASAGTLDGPVVTNAIVFQKPLPAIAEELHACLVAFRDMKAVDVLKCEPELIACDYTPDILPEVPVAQLVALLDIPEGSVLKLRAFCRVWYTALEAERRRS